MQASGRYLGAVFLFCLGLLHGPGLQAADREQAVHIDEIDVSTLLNLAEQGDARASFLLGTRYASGRGGVKDDSQAIRWFREASERGLAEAQYNLAIMYASGRGVKRDLVQSARWLEDAAEQGLAEAQFNLGALYIGGKGVQKDMPVGIDWMQRAAEGGMAEAQYNMGVLYEHGQGVRKDLEQSLRWYRRASGQGFQRAHDKVARLEPVFQAGQGEELTAIVESPPPAPMIPLKAPVRHHNAWVRDQKARHYTIQLLSGTSEREALSFLKQHGLPDGHFFRWEKDQAIWYTVVSGSYQSYKEAEAVRAALPEKLARLKPWVRRFEKLQRVLKD